MLPPITGQLHRYLQTDEPGLWLDSSRLSGHARHHAGAGKMGPSIWDWQSGAVDLGAALRWFGAVGLRIKSAR